MKLIIDIPDKVYNEHREGVMSMENNCIISNAVFDGIPYEERPQGEWKYSDDIYETLVCSVCGFDTADYTRHDFCPNCGAKMQKGGAE